MEFRITRTYEQVEPVCEWLKEQCEKVIIYEHTADRGAARTHIHGLIFPAINSDTLKYRITKTLGEKLAKTDWKFSTKRKDGTEINDEFIVYMSKGELYPKCSKGYSEEFIEEQRKKFVKPVTANLKLLNGKFVKEVVEGKKKTRRALVQEMVESIEYMNSPKHCVERIRKVLVDNNEVIGMYKVLDYYDSVQMYGNKDAFVDAIVHKINSRNRI